MSASATTGADVSRSTSLETHTFAFFELAAQRNIPCERFAAAARRPKQGRAYYSHWFQAKRSKKSWRIDEAIHCSPGHDHEPGACHRRFCANTRQGRQGRKSRRPRSEEHTSELQSPYVTSDAVF